MRILIISRTPWNNSNSFGNTFSNLFEGMADVEIFNICCQNGEMHNQVVKSAFQMTDKSVLHSIYKRKSKTGWLMTQKVENSENKLNQQLATETVKKRRLIFFMMRDWIWKLGRWKKSKALNDFLKEVKPDMVYLPIYASPYMCDVQQFIVETLGVPVVGHISDDVYGCPANAFLLSKWYRTKLRKKLKKIINTCSYLEVFAKNMQEEYSRIFNKPCYLIGKGVQIDDIINIKPRIPQAQPLHFVYTGNIGDDRYKSLADIGKAINEAFGRDKAILDIYSATPLTKEMEEAICQYVCVKFHGQISKEEVVRVQQESDFLVHVEGFSPTAIFSAKMSFSTKIIDYMMTGKPLLAYGPLEVNSIQVLKENKVGLTATSQEELSVVFARLVEDNMDYQQLTDFTKQYLLKYRNIKKIQSDIFGRMKELVYVNEGFAN